MTTIDIGIQAGTFTAWTSLATSTALNTTNPANETGSLTQFKVKIVAGGITGATTKVGTFYGSGTSWTLRDYETLGAIASGSEQTFSGLSCSVQTGDLVGIYCGNSTGYPYNGTTGEILCHTGDCFSAGAITYTSYASSNAWVYGTGYSITGWAGKIWGVTNPAKILGVSVANISKVGGI